MKRLLSVAAAALATGLVTPSVAATLIVDENGQLTGATGVDVFGVSYDVEFLDGTIESVFVLNNDFPFSTIPLNSAGDPGNILLSQVFIGVFDDDASLTRGCETSLRCVIEIPYASSQLGFSSYAAVNYSLGFGEDFPAVGGGQLTDDLGLDPNRVFARFALSGTSTPPVYGAVPEPATWAMMLFGFFGIGGTLRSVRRRQKLSVSYS